MVKIYVNPSKNKCEEFLQNHIVLGCKVIVVDGSYMTNTNKSEPKPRGIDFHEGDNYELLTVVEVNTPFRTAYEPRVSNILGHHNNCKIQSNNGEQFYCSLINIRRFEL
jgi:hypothetical protein